MGCLRLGLSQRKSSTIGPLLKEMPRQLLLGREHKRALSEKHSFVRPVGFLYVRVSSRFPTEDYFGLEEFTHQPCNLIGLDLELLDWALEIPQGRTFRALRYRDFRRCL